MKHYNPCAAMVLLFTSYHRSEALLGGSILRTSSTESGQKQGSFTALVHRPAASFVAGPRRLISSRLQVKDNNDNDDDDNSKSSKVVDDMVDGAAKDLFVFDNLILWEKVNGLVAAAAWGFLAVGFLLNVFGYDFIVKGGKLTVDTLDKAQFEKEVNRVMKGGGSTKQETAGSLHQVMDKYSQF